MLVNAVTRYPCNESQAHSLPLSFVTNSGEEADVASGLSQAKTNPLETALQAREQVNNLMERYTTCILCAYCYIILYYCRLRHGPLVDVEFLIDVLPQLIVDFLPPMEVLQTVVNEFISPHQSRPELAAMVMAEVRVLKYSNYCILIMLNETGLQSAASPG